MVSKTNRLKADDMWCRRFDRSPIRTGQLITGNKIIYDNLENGIFKIYEQTKHPFNDAPALTIQDTYPDGILVAESYTNPDWRSRWQGGGAFIHKISWKNGYGNLAGPMIQQILHYASFHNMFWIVGIPETEYEKCLPYAKEELARFVKKDKVYISQLLDEWDGTPFKSD